MKIEDVARKDAPTVTNTQGGKQSHIPVRFDLIDGNALFAMAAVLHEGAEKYGENNWRNIPVNEHLNHLLMHTYAYLAGDISDEHLSHILCRATFALGVSNAPVEPIQAEEDDCSWCEQPIENDKAYYTTATRDDISNYHPSCYWERFESRGY